MRLASVLVAASLCFTTAAHAADARAVVAVARQRIETTDAHATGRLVHVDATGNRVTNQVSLKAHWFPGVLRVLLEISPSRNPAAGAPESTAPGTRVSILLEMRPGGQDTVRIFQPHQSAPASLPFSRWGESVAGTDFNYEDFLQAEFYWPNQEIVKTARLGTRDCDVLKSTPGGSDRSHYADVQTWLDHTIGYPLYAEKTQKDGGGVKEFTSLGLTQSAGVWSARQVQVKVHGRPGSTLLIFERGSAKAHLTEQDFSPEKISKFEEHP